jgi:hypothetical protein
MLVSVAARLNCREERKHSNDKDGLFRAAGRRWRRGAFISI